MKSLQLSVLTKSLLIAVTSLAVSAASSSAISFTVSDSEQHPSNVGTITLTQVNGTTVNVLVDLLNGYGLLNTGGPHTPFAFSISGSESGVTANFITPSGGTYPAGQFSLNLGGGAATPFGTFGIAIDSTGQNGAPGAFYGDLQFNLTRAGGLLVTDFTTNPDGYFFGADIIDPNGKTASSGWKTPSNDRSVPDGGSTLALLGCAITGLGLIRRKLS